MRVEHLDAGDPGWVDDPRLADYRNVRDPHLVRRSARFVAEGRLVVRTLLTQSPLETCSVLVDERAWTWLEGELAATSAPDVPVFVAPAGSLEQIAGWKFHQGCLAVGRRPEPRTADDVLAACSDAPLVVGLDTVSNPDNVGAIFRSAAALGACGVILSPACASPLYRKAARTSMGAALTLPFSHGPEWRDGLERLRAAGVSLVALVPDADAEPLEEVARSLGSAAPRALLLGAEGEGLGPVSLELADRRAGIPMAGGIDSLNVAAAAAIALYRLRP